MSRPVNAPQPGEAVAIFFEGDQQRPARTTTPARSLFSVHRPLPYVPAVKTDVRRTMRKFRLLARIQSANLPRPEQLRLPV